MTNDDAIKYLKQIYPNGGHCWLDEQRTEAIGMAVKALQEEPKKCMYSKDNYTDEDRQVLCDGCKEFCKYNKKETVSEDLEEVIDTYLATYFGGKKEKQDWPFLKKMAIHFAQWQKEQDQETIELAEDHAMLAGMEKMKEQMLRNAITAEVRVVEDFMGTMTLRCLCDKYKQGDKVKIVILKAE